MNSIRNEFDALKVIVLQNFNILMVAEAKLMINFQKNNSMVKTMLIHCDLIEMVKMEVVSV